MVNSFAWLVAWLAFSVFLVVTNAVLLIANLHRRSRKYCITSGIALAISLITCAVFSNLMWPLYLPECRNAPAQVPFRQGMTLCPGQSAVIEMVIPIRPPGHDL
jgi:hypothetical protein